jgi:predicted small lipoprotein YifL
MSWVRAWVLLSAVSLAACGAARPEAPPDEVTETWTTGDDAPLQGAAEER